MRELYKRFVKTWICFTNPWICFVSWNVFKRFVSWIRFVDLFSKDSPISMNPTNPYESLRILSTIAQNESLKIKIPESESLRILQLRIRESEP